MSEFEHRCDIDILDSSYKDIVGAPKVVCLCESVHRRSYLPFGAFGGDRPQRLDHAYELAVLELDCGNIKHKPTRLSCCHWQQVIDSVIAHVTTEFTTRLTHSRRSVDTNTQPKILQFHSD